MSLGVKEEEELKKIIEEFKTNYPHELEEYSDDWFPIDEAE